MSQKLSHVPWGGKGLLSLQKATQAGLTPLGIRGGALFFGSLYWRHDDTAILQLRSSILSFVVWRKYVHGGSSR